MPRREAGVPARYILTFLGFLGFLNAYAMRVNLSVAIVAMAKSVVDPSLNSSTVQACVELIPNITTNSTNLKPVGGEFDWDSKTQVLILGSFFYGYVVTQIPGGILAEKFGGKWVFGIGVLVTSVLTLLTPLAARTSVATLVVVRILEGLGEGVTYPAINVLIAKWVPLCERSSLASFIYTGSQVGTIFGMGFSGMLSASGFLGGWPSVFYVFGLCGCVWFVFWSFFTFESPSVHPRISASEVAFIKSKQENTENVGPVPWKAILTSVPVWALSLAHFGHNWGFYTLLTEMPTYLGNVLHFNIAQNGVLSAIPYTVKSIVACLAGFVADKIISKGYLKITTVRKIFNTIGFFGPGIFILSVIFAGCRPYFAVVILSVTVGLNGCIYSGFHVTHVDMSLRYAGTLMGITSTVANMSGFLAPAVAGSILDKGQSRKNWGIVFVIASVMYFVIGLIYDIFCTAEVQTWGDPSDENCNNTEIHEVRPAEDIPVKSTES